MRKRLAVDCCAPGRTRRDALRFLGLAAVALPAALRPAGAGATHGWCQRDPIVQIDGQTAHIWLTSYKEMLDLATGPAQVVVTVPAGVSTSLVATDPGFGGHGYDVQFAEANGLTNTPQVLEVRIEVYAPANDAPESPLPVTVEFIPRGDGRLVAGETLGEANTWVTLQTS